MVRSSGDSPNVSQTRLYLLGSVRVERVSVEAGRSARSALRLPTRKVEALLAFLALHPTAHLREKLAALLWGDSPDELARGSLRKALTLLRTHLGEDLLLADREVVQLNPAFPLWVDALSLETRAEALLAAPAAAAARAEAVDMALYRGELLADFYDDWIIPLREHLRDLFLAALLRLTQAVKPSLTTSG